MQDLAGKKILVCGGLGRMGSAICSHLVSIKAIPIVVDSQKNEIEASLSYKCDLSDVKQTELVFAQIFEEHSRVDHLINAIRLREGNLKNKSLENASALIIKELNAFLYPMHFFCLKKRALGSLVNISSILGTKVDVNVPLEYHVAKAGMEQASRYYAANYERFKVRINCISPGLISNGAGEYFSNSLNDSNYARLSGILPAQFSGGHDSVANLAAFLLSNSSKFLIGENIKLDGGGNLLEPLSISKALEKRFNEFKP